MYVIIYRILFVLFSNSDCILKDRDIIYNFHRAIQVKIITKIQMQLYSIFKNVAYVVLLLIADIGKRFIPLNIEKIIKNKYYS